MASLYEGLTAGQDEEEGRSFEHMRETLAWITENWRSRAKWRVQRKSRDADCRASWRKKLGEILESTTAHAIILSLLLLDLVATVVDVLHTLHNDSYDLSKCVAMVESCQCTPSFEQSEGWEFLGYVGIFVLCVLALNILGLLVAFGLQFFRHPGYVLDLVVVITALALEIFLNSETAGLLVILNLWRIVRVAHGVFEVTDEAWEKQVHKLENEVKAAEMAHQRDVALLSEKQQRIEQLEQKLDIGKVPY